jgi:hypothetical protein
MHTEAERTERALLPEVVAEVIERNTQRRRVRRTVWQAHVKTAQAWRAGHERMAAAAATRAAGVDLEAAQRFIGVWTWACCLTPEYRFGSRRTPTTET